MCIPNPEDLNGCHCGQINAAICEEWNRIMLWLEQ